MIIIKINEISEATKAIKIIRIEKANKTIEIKARIKKNVNSEIRTSIIIFIMKRFFVKCASTRKRMFEIIKNFVNMLFVKRLCDVCACEKTFFDLLKCEQCDINHVII